MLSGYVKISVHTHLHNITKKIDLQDSAYIKLSFNTEFNLKGARGVHMGKMDINNLWVYLIY